MNLEKQLALYNKNLPVWYQLPGVLKRVSCYWSGSVANSSVPRFSKGLSLTFCQGVDKSIADWTSKGYAGEPPVAIVRHCY